MNLRRWLETIAFALNDAKPGHEFTRYPVQDMIAALNAALCLVAKYRPDLFTELRVVKLDAGPHQDVRGCCVNILGVLEQTDEVGNILGKLNGSRKTKTKVPRVWNKESCLKPKSEDPKDFRLSSARVDKNLNGRFEVEPPVPCDVDVYVRVKCVTEPCKLEEGNLDQPVLCGGNCDFMVAAWHYVLATMLTGDRFDNANGDKSMQYHYRMFFDILGVVQNKEDRSESPQEATA
jgi:hypothetical protein